MLDCNFTYICNISLQVYNLQVITYCFNLALCISHSPEKFWIKQREGFRSEFFPKWTPDMYALLDIEEAVFCVTELCEQQNRLLYPHMDAVQASLATPALGGDISMVTEFPRF